MLGACAFIVTTFLVLYPNLSALPMPANIISVYNGLLPSWFYGFEFAVNLQPGLAVKIVSSSTILLSLVVLLVAGVAAWAAWERRAVIGYRRVKLLASDADGDSAPEPESRREDTPEA